MMMMMMMARKNHRRFFAQPELAIMIVAASLLLFGPVETASAQELPSPPVAKKVPKNLTIHNHTRVDNYYWLNQREDPEVLAYLHAENNYTEAVMAHTEALQNDLFEEIKGRIKQDDSSVPFIQKNYYYYARYEEGKEYPLYCRKRESLDAEEEVMFDVNVYAEGKSYYYMRFPSITSNEQIAAFAFDDFGRRIYTINFKDLSTGTTYPNESITNVTGGMVWAEDSLTLFYAKRDPQTLRSYQIWRHTLGTDPADDVLVFEETDDTFSCYVGKTKTNAYVKITSYHTLRTEVRVIDAFNPTVGDFKVFLPREGEHEYYIQHYEDSWFIYTNDQAENFRLMSTEVASDTTDKSLWTEIIPHREDVLLENFEVFANHLVLTERKEGLLQIRIIPWDETSEEHYLDFGEPVYYATLGRNSRFNTTLLRYEYESFTTPTSIFDYDMNTREKTLLKQTEVLGGDFAPSNYVSERLFAPALDGRRIPISLVRHKAVDPTSGNNPLLQHGYGAYGYSLDAYFSTSRLSLLDRGFIFAIAHVRGGYEMGRWWYEEGKLLNKKNTFTDFIDVGRYLVDQNYTSPEKLYCSGGSAGGLLVGAVINMAPELYHGCVADVPFVDVVTTMLDETIPLTTGEFDEWGNPQEFVYYEYILSYSPYDQVTQQDYPNLLVTAGLHDSQVQYWEPAKWTAKLREYKTDDNWLLLKTNMDAGHSGASGRFQQFRDIAFRWAYLLDLADSWELLSSSSTHNVSSVNTSLPVDPFPNCTSQEEALSSCVSDLVASGGVEQASSCAACLEDAPENVEECSEIATFVNTCGCADCTDEVTIMVECIRQCDDDTSAPPPTDETSDPVVAASTSDDQDSASMQMLSATVCIIATSAVTVLAF